MLKKIPSQKVIENHTEKFFPITFSVACFRSRKHKNGNNCTNLNNTVKITASPMTGKADGTGNNFPHVPHLKTHDLIKEFIKVCGFPRVPPLRATSPKQALTAFPSWAMSRRAVSTPTLPRLTDSHDGNTGRIGQTDRGETGKRHRSPYKPIEAPTSVFPACLYPDTTPRKNAIYGFLWAYRGVSASDW